MNKSDNSLYAENNQFKDELEKDIIGRMIRIVESSESRLKALSHANNQELLKALNEQTKDLEHIKTYLVEDISEILKDLSQKQQSLEKSEKDLLTRAANIERKLDQLRKASHVYWKEDSYQRYEKIVDVDKRFDVCILGGISARNYGAALTLYAIARLIEDMGYSVVIGDAPDISPGGIEGKFDEDNPTRVFIDQKFNKTRMIRYPKFSLFNEICKCVLYPSDSIWGKGYRTIIYGHKGCDVGEGIDDNIPIISFSTSFGAWNPEPDNSIERRYMSNLLKRFIHISSREKEGVKVLKDTFGINASWTLDPVFLLDVSKFEEIEEDIQVSGSQEADVLVSDDDYICVYVLQPTEEKIELLQELSKQLSIKVVFIPDLNNSLKNEALTFYKNFDVLTNVTFGQWLRVIHGAKYVISDSFHGVCFSLIYSKQFIGLPPRDAANRIKNIAEFCGLDDRIDITDTGIARQLLEAPIDYTYVERKIAHKAAEDFMELKNALIKALQRFEKFGNEDFAKLTDDEIKTMIYKNRILAELG